MEAKILAMANRVTATKPPTSPQGSSGNCLPTLSRGSKKAAVGGKRSKYRNEKVELHGMKFDSKREARRWLYLVGELRAGRVQFLRRQVIYRIRVKGIRVCNFVADFVYVQDGRLVVEDCKGFRTAVYKLKRRLMGAVFGIEVRET